MTTRSQSLGTLGHIYGTVLGQEKDRNLVSALELTGFVTIHDVLRMSKEDIDDLVYIDRQEDPDGASPKGL